MTLKIFKITSWAYICHIYVELLQASFNNGTKICNSLVIYGSCKYDSHSENVTTNNIQLLTYVEVDMEGY